MALDSIKTGLRVFTNARRYMVKGQMTGPVGGSKGVIDQVVRHPITRNITAVILNTGSTDPDSRVVVPVRWLRQSQEA